MPIFAGPRLQRSYHDATSYLPIPKNARLVGAVLAGLYGKVKNRVADSMRYSKKTSSFHNLLQNRLLYAVQSEHRGACLHCDTIFHSNHPSSSLDNYSIQNIYSVHLTDPYASQILLRAYRGIQLI